MQWGDVSAWLTSSGSCGELAPSTCPTLEHVFRGAACGRGVPPRVCRGEADEAQELLDFAARCEAAAGADFVGSTVLAGDLNTTPGSEAHELLRGAWAGLSRRVVAPRSWGPWRASRRQCPEHGPKRRGEGEASSGSCSQEVDRGVAGAFSPRWALRARILTNVAAMDRLGALKHGFSGTNGAGGTSAHPGPIAERPFRCNTNRRSSLLGMVLSWATPLSTPGAGGGSGISGAPAVGGPAL